MRSWTRMEKVVLGAFLLWSAAGFIFTVLHVTADNISSKNFPGWLVEFIKACLKNGDPILILLAFANTHLHAARQWTSTVARRWVLIVLVCSFAVETLGACTGFPFGSYHYTDHFGPLLGAVPMTIPLAWYVVLTNSLFIVPIFVRYPRLIETLLAASLCTIYDAILEPFATTVKAYWVWAGGTIPLQNFAAWFILSALIIGFFAPRVGAWFQRDPRPSLILGITVLIFLAGRWSAGW